MSASAIYAGVVTHERFRPKAHRMRHRMFQILFDLNEIDGLDRRLRLFSRNRFNLVGFRDRDYGDRSETPLRTQIEGHLRAAGMEPDGGPIRVLTMPRILGHVFNPISTWFCHRADGTLMAIVYEVTNTFHDRHLYLIPVRAEGFGNLIRQSAPKRLHDSPFMDMDMRYTLSIRRPREEVEIIIDGSDADGALMNATFTARRRVLSDAGLVRTCLAYPLMTLMVVANIRIAALILRAKGLKPRHRPPPPQVPVTIGE